MSSEASHERCGVLLVGLNGATASTFVAGVCAMAQGATPAEYGVTALPELRSLNLVQPSQLRFGGWDLVPGSVADTVDKLSIVPREILDGARSATSEIHALPGLRTDLDVPHEPAHESVYEVDSFDAAVDNVQDNIREFRTLHRLERVIVVYLGSPPRVGARDLTAASLDELRGLPREQLRSSISAGLLYAVGACLAGATFVDFTPSPTLEYAAVRTLAIDSGVQLAGRDGSTGQTMLKAAIADLLRVRNIHLDSWYSTNVLGNHDGYVLGLPGHSEVKIRDKTEGLAPILGYDDFEHRVTIDFVETYGDCKESWDAVEAHGWLGSKVSLKLNWRGQDSLLAAPLLFDLVRLLDFGSRHALAGLQEQLGLFFKRPFGREDRTLSDRYRELCAFYTSLNGRRNESP